MPQGTYGRQKTVHKASHWHWHGKHRPILGFLCAWRRARMTPPSEPMFESVREAFAASTAKHRHVWKT